MRYTWLGDGRLKVSGVGFVAHGESFDSREELRHPDLVPIVEPSPAPVPDGLPEPPPPQGRRKRR